MARFVTASESSNGRMEPCKRLSIDSLDTRETGEMTRPRAMVSYSTRMAITTLESGRTTKQMVMGFLLKRKAPDTREGGRMISKMA